MITIGRTDFYIDVPEISSIELERYSTQLFDDWEKYTSEHLHLSDYSLLLEVEEGSIKALKKIGVTAGVLYLGIGQYGSFISGVNTIYDQTKAVAEYFTTRASAPFAKNQEKPRVRRSGATLSRLKMLFHKVKNRELTVEEAMQESKKFLGDEINEVPEFLKDLQYSLENTPLNPEQINLPFEFEEIEQEDEEDEEELPPSTPSKKPKPSVPRQPAIPSSHLKIQVWRESRKSKKNVRVTKS